MKLRISLVLLMFAGSSHASSMIQMIGSLAGADSADSRQYKPDVFDLHLSMDELESEILFKKEPHDKSPFSVKVLHGGREMPGEVKVKGSFTRNFIKKSIVIKLEKGNAWRGMRKFALNAMSTDPSDMREKLAWDLIRDLGMSAPDVNYVRLFINDRFIGLYLQMEWITDATFKRHGLGKGGDFLHPIDSSYCGDMSEETVSIIDECWFNLTPKPNAQVFGKLRKLVNEINSSSIGDFESVLEKHFDVDSVINWLVVNTITSNGDTYNKNYFMYNSPVNGKWHIIPWDYDLSFGRNADPGMPFPRNVLNSNYYYLHTPDLGLPNPLKNKTLSNNSLMERYRRRVAHVLGIRHDGSSDRSFGWFSPKKYLARLGSISKAISSDIKNDLYQPLPASKVIEHTDALAWYGVMRHSYLAKILVRPSPFGTSRWKSGTNYPLLVEKYPVTIPLSLSGNATLEKNRNWAVPTDNWLSRPMGLFHFPGLRDEVRIRIEIEGEQNPLEFPPGYSASSCIKRSWYIDIKKPNKSLMSNIYLDFVQENSLHHELGSIEQFTRLSLWKQDNGKWKKLDTRYNTYSNTLSASNVMFHKGGVSLILACTEKK